MTNPTVNELITRSNRLGSDPKNTNYAGGNTSAKGVETDPVTGEPVELLWVKGSGGDLGTLTENGLAVLRLDRMRALVDVYPGVEREDEMVAAFDYCLHGRGGAAPSIDTAMHGLVDAAHVDHLHPDSGIALATAADGEALTKQIFGDRVVWIPWRRPGFQLGLDIAEIKRRNPQAIGTILGGHGITAWGDTSAEAEARSLEIIDTAERYIDTNGKSQPFGPPLAGYEALPEMRRRRKAAQLAPFIRGLASADKPQVGHFTDDPRVLEFLSASEHPRLAALGTSCPDHFLRTKVKPMVLDLPADASIDDAKARLAELHESYRADYQAYYDRHASPDSPGIRGADPAIVLIPGVGMFSYGKDKQTARVAGEFYLNAINVMRGAEAISHLRPHRRIREVPHRVLGTGRGQAGADAQAKAPGHPHRSGHRRRLGYRQGHRDAAGRRGRLRGDRRPRRRQGRGGGRGDRQRRCRRRDRGRRHRRGSRSRPRSTRRVLAFGGIDIVVNNAGLSLSKSLLETTAADWDLQHNVMARGSFLVSKAAR